MALKPDLVLAAAGYSLLYLLLGGGRGGAILIFGSFPYSIHYRHEGKPVSEGALWS
jgi:hypothetical protein